MFTKILNGMYISLIIPVYNEEKCLPILHKQLSDTLKKSRKTYEMVFIDDGSVDDSLKVLKQIRLEDDSVKIISFDRNYGQTSALDAGLKFAKGKYVLTIDADLQLDSSDLLRILKKLKEFDVVICYRKNRREIDGYLRFIASKIGNYVRNKMLKENFRDTGCFLKGYRKEILNELKLYGGFQMFTASLLKLKGFRITEIPVNIHPRKYGKSKYTVNQMLVEELSALLMVKWIKHNLLKYEIKRLYE